MSDVYYPPEVIADLRGGFQGSAEHHEKMAKVAKGEGSPTRWNWHRGAAMHCRDLLAWLDRIEAAQVSGGNGTPTTGEERDSRPAEETGLRQRQRKRDSDEERETTAHKGS